MLAPIVQAGVKPAVPVTVKAVTVTRLPDRAFMAVAPFNNTVSVAARTGGMTSGAVRE